MSSISELKQVVKDYLQVTSPPVVDTTLDLGGSTVDKNAIVDRLILQGANNAKKWAEKKHSFSFADTTLFGTIPIDSTGMAFDDLHGWPRYTATAVFDGATNVTLSGGVDQVGDDSTDYYVAASDGICVSDVNGSFTNKYLTNNGSALLYTDANGITAGTYTVYLRDVPLESSFNYDPRPFHASRSKIVKAIQGVWLYDKTENAVTPIHYESKSRMKDRLLENMDLNTVNYPILEEGRIITHGRRLYAFPNNSEEIAYLHVDVCAFTENYLLDCDSDEFLLHGFEFMQWATIVEVNRLIQRFVIRQEGNLPPPTTDRDRALKDFIEWDIMQTEEGRNEVLD